MRLAILQVARQSSQPALPSGTSLVETDTHTPPQPGHEGAGAPGRAENSCKSVWSKRLQGTSLRQGRPGGEGRGIPGDAASVTTPKHSLQYGSLLRRAIFAHSQNLQQQITTANNGEGPRSARLQTRGRRHRDSRLFTEAEPPPALRPLRARASGHRRAGWRDPAVTGAAGTRTPTRALGGGRDAGRPAPRGGRSLAGRSAGRRPSGRAGPGPRGRPEGRGAAGSLGSGTPHPGGAGPFAASPLPQPLASF